MTAQPPPGVAEAAIALVTADLAQVSDEVVDAILADVDARELALYLGGVVALAVRETTGGQRWLRRWGLATAQGVS
jgi:hypothetical protein